MTDGFRLVMTQGPQPGQTFTLTKDVMSVGRDPSNDIVINHPQVSRQHARLIRQGGVVVLEDLGSTNGTFVNGVRLTAPHTLTNGDVIGLGEAVRLTFHGPAGAGDATEVLKPGAVPTPSPPPPAPEPAYAPPPAPAPEPAYAPPPPPAYGPPPPVEVALPEEEEKKGRRWVWIGCGCLVLLVVLGCVAVVVLDQMGWLPSFFYQPLYWFGLERYFLPTP